MRTHFLALSLYFSYFCGEKVQTEIISTMRKNIFLLGAAVLLLLVACGQRGQYDAQFGQIDSLADVRPKEADSLLQSLAPAMDKAAKGDTMCYALLRLKTDDKLYLNITDHQLLSQRLVEYFEHHNKSLLPTALFYAGRVCADLGDAPQALDYYQKTLDAMPETNSRLRRLNYEQMGYIFHGQALYEDAVLSFRNAYALNKDAGDTLGMVYNLRDIAVSFKLQESFDSCRQYFMAAQDLAIRKGLKRMRYDIQSQLAATYYHMGQIEKALQVLRPALAHADTSDFHSVYAIAAKIYWDLQMTDSARHYLELLQTKGNVYGKRTAHEKLAELCIQDKQPDLAIAHLKIQQMLADSIRKLDNAAIVKRVNAMYNYQLHVDEKHRIEKEKQRGEAILSMAIFGLAALLLFVGYRYKAKINEARARYERLLLMEKENSLLRGDRSKAANPEQVVAGMDYFQTTNIWRRMQEMLVSTAAFPMKLTDEDWEKLKREIETAWPLFMDKLRSLYPNLNKRQMRVCLLTKIGLKPKLVAELVDLSEQGVGSLKRRLYEKAFNEKGGTKDFDSSILLI